MEITSLTNSKVKQWVKYKEKKYREIDQKFLIEGEHLIEEAHKANLIDCIMIEQDRECRIKGYDTYEVTKDIMRKLSDRVSGTFIMAVCRMPIHGESYGDHVILLDDVQDPGNVGTIIRTALSFGYDSVILSSHCVDVFNEKVIRSTQGALFHMPVFRTNLIDAIIKLKEQKVCVYATSLHDAKGMQELQVSEKVALIVGNEGAGVSESVLAMSDQKVCIEMNTFESLNVAVAAGICMYHFKK